MAMIICTGITRPCDFPKKQKDAADEKGSDPSASPKKKRKKKRQSCGGSSSKSSAPSVGSFYRALLKRTRRHSLDESLEAGLLFVGGGGNGDRSGGSRKKLQSSSSTFSSTWTIKSDGELDGVKPRTTVRLFTKRERGVKVPRRRQNGATRFIPAQEVIPVDEANGEVQALFVSAFLHNNRLEHMVQVMGFHPRYLDAFLKTQEYMLRGDGPLPYDYRHYIAIMAAGRHQCSYLIHLQTSEFLMVGGNPAWLKGLPHVPQKLRDLYDINKILAHRPWLLTKGHLEKLTRGNDNWSISELMHAMVILAHFHALSSFIYGCGINAEVDSEDGHTLAPPSPGGTAGCSPSSSPLGTTATLQATSSPLLLNGSSSSGSGSVSSSSAGTSSLGSVSGSGSVEEVGGIEVLMERMRKLTEEAQEEMSQEEQQKRFERIETQSAELPAASKQPSPKADVLRYVDDPDFTYQDFAKRGTPSDIPTFRAQDYSWEEQGFTLANRLYSEIGVMLDDKFSIAKDLTYYTMGDRTDVDTTSFRRSIWNYIHCMFGIRHDDYDYSEVNQLLERALKAYIKTVTCYPERITRKDYDSFMREFKHSEKVHVNLMLLEARMQAELLYSLRAITKHFT